MAAPEQIPNEESVDQLRRVPRERWGYGIQRLIERAERASGQSVSLYELPNGHLLLIEHPGAQPTRERMQQALDAIRLGSTNPEGQA